jgi:hypothetical protein
MSTTEVWERLAHIAFALSLLAGLALFSGTTMSHPAISASSSTVAAPALRGAALDAAPDLKLQDATPKFADLGATCDGR